MLLRNIAPGNSEVLTCAGLAHLAWRADPTAQTGFLRETGPPLRFVAPHDALAGERPALERYHVATGKSGSNTILRPAVPTTNG